MKERILYHGSCDVIEKPLFGRGKPYNDYGLGFYCTESLELAKEWACTPEFGGYANRYALNMEGLRFVDLSGDGFHVLNWLAVLVKNRTFNVTSALAVQAKDYLLDEFLPSFSGVDVVKGYRADDSYFSFAQSFLNGGLSLSQLSRSMKLGELGEQIVLVSQTAFDNISFLGAEKVNHFEYSNKRLERDALAREAFRAEQRSIMPVTEIYIIDILREEWKNDDSRLQ